MRVTIFALSLFVIVAFAPSGVLGQRAMKPLLPEGQLFLPIGSISPMEKDLRAYGEFGFATGDAGYTDGTNYDVDADWIAPAIDIKTESSIISLGYSTATTTLSTVVSGVSIEQESDRTSLGGRVSFQFGDSGVAAVQVFMEDRTLTISGSSGGISISNSADTGFIDISVGAGLDLSERIRIAGEFSPEVSDKAQFTGFLAGFETRDGHGAQIGLGLGYNTPDFAAGFDVILESESQDSGAAEELTVAATAEVLLGKSSVTGQFAFFQGEQLTIDGSLQSPDTEGTIIGILYRVPVGGGVLGLEYQRLDMEGFDSGDTAFDADRFDSQELTFFSVRFMVDF